MPDLNCNSRERLARHEQHERFWNRFYAPTSRWIRRKFNFSCDDLGGIEGPYFLLCNHNTDFDPIFVGVAIRNQAYFVASEHVLHKGNASRLLMRYLCPIIHQKSRTSARSAMEMLRTLKAGCSVVLFPEGNRSFNGVTCEIPFATAKLVRKTGCKLVTMRLEGGYLTQPRWCLEKRKGRIFGRLVGVYEPEQLKAMGDQELYDQICADLHENAFDRQRQIAEEEGHPVEFVGKALASGMESTLFMCPSCGEIGTLSSNGENIHCRCGFKARFTTAGFFENCRFPSIYEWDLWQREQLEQKIASIGPEESVPLFSDRASLQLLGTDHKVFASCDGVLSAYSDGFGFTPNNMPTPIEGLAAGVRKSVTLDDIAGLAIYSRNVIVTHVGESEQHCEVRGGIHFNALKYKYAYEIIESLAEKRAEPKA